MDTNVKIKELEEKIEKYELQEMGVYIPNHILNTKTEFSNAIKENLKEQRKYCSSKNMFFTIGTLQDLLLENFNFKCSQLITKLNGYNLQSAKLKVQEYANELIDICDMNRIKIISHRLFELKIEQLTLENDFLLFQAEEKYRKKEQARKIHEQRIADQEWFDTLKSLELKQEHYINTDDTKALSELAPKIEEAKKMLKERKAGWVYIISNEDMIEGIYKVGVTRRPNAIVRINELSNASHAFKFKIHAIIYSDSCFELEAALHRRLTEYRVNKDNFHKEFFKISLDELQKILNDEFNIDTDMIDNMYDDDKKLNEFYNFSFDEE